MVAVNVVIPDVPPMFSVALVACVRPPVPESAVLTVNVLVLVRVIVVTVTLGMENVPVNACALVLNVCTPVPAVNVPLLVIPPWNVTPSFPELFHVAPVLIVTNPVNCRAALVAVIFRIPLAPPPIDVGPVAVNA